MAYGILDSDVEKFNMPDGNGKPSEPPTQEPGTPTGSGT